MEVFKMLEPLGMLQALRALDAHFDSVRYDTTSPPPRRRKPSRMRAKTADALHRLANVIQPHTEPSPRQHTCSAIGA
jgi:hypothetical protein